MKNLIFIPFFLLLINLAFAHSGGLNSEGCHNNKKTGEYHCHRSNSDEVTKKVIKQSYNRKNWKFISKNSPYSESTLGFYTQIEADKTDVDHIVALKDAYDSGGKKWHNSTKKLFSNDSENHAPALPYVNRVIKNKYTPKIFIIRLKENASFDFAVGIKCEYLKRYVYIKKKYKLNYDNNDVRFIKNTLKECL